MSGKTVLEILLFALVLAYAVAVHVIAASALRARSRRHGRQLTTLEADDEEGSTMNLVDILDAAVDFVTIGQVNGRPLYINPAARRALGIDPTERIHSLADFRPPTFLAYLHATILPALEKGASWSGETEYISRDGHVIPVSQVSVGHRNGSGHIQFISTISRNISEQRRHADALRTASARTQFALQAARAAIWEADLSTGEMTCSETAPIVMGRSRAELPSTVEQFLALIQAADREVVRAALAEPADAAREFELEVRLGWPDGTTHWIQLRGQVLGDPAGRPVRVLAVLHDITEHKELEAQLRQAQKMEAVGQLAGGVAHDFNNLLMAITGYSQLAIDQLEPSHPVIQDLAEIRKAGETAATLTRQLLTFSRRDNVRPRPVELDVVIGKLLPMLRRLVGEHVEIVEAHDHKIHPVLADPGQLEQIVMNLAVNARDAMPHGGRLTIRARQARVDGSHEAGRLGLKPGVYGVIEIRDTGSGMDAATRERIFEPFFTTKAPGIGTGLGLSTVYRIVQQLGGAIRVESAPQQGALFTVFLPRARDTQKEAAEAAAADSQGSETVLLVEDDDAVRSLIAGLLERSGYRVMAADAPEAARLRAAESGGSIDLVIADVMMPGGTGADLLVDLRARWGFLPALFMSGYERAALVAQGALGSDSAFIQKPFKASDLLGSVRQVLISAPPRSPITAQPQVS